MTAPLDVPGFTGWHVADVSGTGVESLIRVGRTPTDARNSVWVLRGMLDGTFAREQEFVDGLPSFLGGTLGDAGVNSLDWQPLTVDGGSRSALASVRLGPGQSVGVSTVLHQGDRWKYVFHSYGLNLPEGVTGGPLDGDWIPVDVNGDGAVDLVNVWSSSSGLVQITTLLSHGDGAYTVTTTEPDSQPFGGPTIDQQPNGAAANDWRPVDIGHDGRAALVHVYNHEGRLVLDTLLPLGDGSWHDRQVGVDLPGPGLPDSWQWDATDLAGSGASNIFRLDQVGQHLYVTSYSPTDNAPDTIETTSNGLGTTTAVIYEPSTSMLDSPEVATTGCGPAPVGNEAPPDDIHFVVVQTSVADRPSGTVDATSRHYGCPLWSANLRELLGWGEAWTVHAATVNRPQWTEQVTSAAPARLTNIVQAEADVVTGTGGPRAAYATSRTISHYLPLDQAPTNEVPFKDQLVSQDTSLCERGRCATTTSRYAYDAFGNVTSTDTVAAGTGRERLARTLYAANVGKFIVSLPENASSKTSETVPAAAVLRARSSGRTHATTAIAHKLASDHPPAG